MTHDEREAKLFRIGLIKTLCAQFEEEHDFDGDEDITATWEMIAECRALAAEMVDAVPPAEGPPPTQYEPGPDIPF